MPRTIPLFSRWNEGAFETARRGPRFSISPRKNLRSAGRHCHNGFNMEARVLAFVLAGGKGTRLYPLTKERAKPAVSFGGRYRIVDFVLSNLLNSGIYSVYVLIQFKSQSLLQHLREGWEVSGLLKEHFIIPVPAQMRSPGEDWYQGTADAIYQNINLIEQAEIGRASCRERV